MSRREIWQDRVLKGYPDARLRERNLFPWCAFRWLAVRRLFWLARQYSTQRWYLIDGKTTVRVTVEFNPPQPEGAQP